MHKMGLIAVCAIAWANVALAAPPANEAAVQTRLAVVLPTVDFDEVALADAVAFLAQAADVGISVDWRSLTAVEVLRSTPVTLHLKKVTIAQALRLVLAAAAGPGEVEYVVHGTSVVVGTPAALKAMPPVATTRPSEAAATQPVAAGTGEQDQAVLKKLQASLPVLTFERFKLVDAIEFFRSTAGVNVFVDWRALKKAGATGDTLITLQRRDTTVAAGLSMTLAEAAAGKLAYGVSGGVVVVTSAELLGRLSQDLQHRPRPQGKADTAAVRALTALVPSMNLPEARLGTLMEFFRKTSAANLYVDWRGLKKAGITPDTPVNIKLENVPVRVAMVLALSAAAPAGTATYDIAAGVVIVSSSEAAAAIASRLRAGPERGATAADRAVVEKLGADFPEFNFNKTELQAVMIFLRESAGANIFMDWRALRRMDISRTSPVTLELRNVPNRIALRLALVEAAPPGAIDYAVRDGLIYIAPPEVLQKLAPPTTPARKP
ncbi:MAG: hypothetical protein ABFD92_08590 [Planctomycetaceae bacterium]|nr:hypothetical protein [Planctomycetaceae bacterium]